MNQFAETYKKFNNETLFNILQNSGDYEPEAVEAARLELVERQLSDEEIDAANQIVERRSQQKQNQLNRQNAFLLQITKFFREWINPTQYMAENAIKGLSVLFTIIAAFRLYHQIVFVKYLLVGNMPLMNWSMFFYYLEVLILPIWVFLFWKRQKMAWVCLVAFITYTIISAGYGLFRHFMSSAAEYNRFTLLSPLPVVAYMVLAIAFLCCIFTKSIRKAFSINKISPYVAILLGAVFTLFWLVYL